MTRWSLACAAAVVSALAFGGCRAPVEVPAPPAPAGPAAPPVDVCVGSKPLEKQYLGVLRRARCDQDRFATMADTATMLGVECRHCHAPLMENGREVPKKEDYPVMTDKKRVANWMSQHLMESIKPADGSQLKCSHCHTDEHGKPAAKFLGEPRDLKKTMEFMNIVMVNRFVGLNGEKLKCKSCHMDNYGTPGFQAKVILTDHIPAHKAPGVLTP